MPPIRPGNHGVEAPKSQLSYMGTPVFGLASADTSGYVRVVVLYAFTTPLW